ncbi:hypothetical protein BN946_scf184894.g6 [Trametes cinnabarina]|uniref:SWIM-type domain-containing protein n=1 Tax=Pycnoporus cinnabarinus TaxID=5643 RepID=A0A060SNU6_PYCCI|nr:hypothetical protein BN946_scf184894.g6 [Trametes cinnabarina]
MSSKVCTICHVDKELAAFPLRQKDSAGGKKGEPGAICAPCVKQRQESRRARKRKAEAEAGANGEAGADGDTEAGAVGQDLGQISGHECIELVKGLDPPIDLRAQVDISDIVPPGIADAREKANRLAEALGGALLLHWSYETVSERKRTGDKVYSFSCAQAAGREHKAKVPKAGKKTRDTRRMDRFPCHGWLHLTVGKLSNVISISLKHALEHVAYVDISLPERWKDFIREQAQKLTPGKIWQHILQEEGDADLPYGPNAVYYYWHVVSQEEWRLADNPLASASKFIKDWGERHHIKVLEVEAEPGTEVLAFYVTDFVAAWARNTQELAMDSTWNTNGGNFELFAAVADLNGAGLPLAFVFIRTTQVAAPGAKQTILERFLSGLKALGVDPEFTLTDKDWSEINAMSATWPDAKQQLCFWHGLRAIKQRLCKTKDTPAPYDVMAARREFTFIDGDFVPAAQRAVAGLEPLPSPPPKPVQRVRLLVNGRPPVLTSSLPKIILTPALIAQALQKQPARMRNDTAGFDVQRASSVTARPSALVVTDDEPLELEDEHSDEGTYWAAREDAGEDLSEDNMTVGWEDGSGSEIDEDDWRAELDRIEQDHSNINPEAASVPSETGPRARSGDYQFCPPAHRLAILRLFAKHACQHPLLPERHGTPRTAEDIYRDAVDEMYRHCKTNHLAEVWAYLWNAWYSRSRWKLWACSAHPSSIPRKRTTMVVEALWRNLKCLILHMYNRPPIDLALYAIVTKSLPPYRQTLKKIIKNPRHGRAAKLTHLQKDFKHAWERLENAPVRGTYQTDITRWTCDCGAQKYHAHLLCKHLVQAAGHLPASWWPTAVHYHIPPFYTVPINGRIAAPPEEVLDHGWAERLHKTTSAITVQHARTPAASEDSDGDVPVYDDGFMSSSSANLRLQALMDYSLDDKEQIAADEVERRLALAIEIFRSQDSNPDPRFFQTAAKCFRTTINWVCELEQHPAPDAVDASSLPGFLHRALALFREQRKQDDPQHVKYATRSVRGTTRWARALELAESRRTMPKTNVHRSKEPSPTYLYGYRYRERESETNGINVSDSS